MADRFVNTASPAGGNGTTNGTGGGDANRAWSTMLEALNGLGASLSTPIDLYCEGTAADTSDVNQTPWDFTTTATNRLRIIGEQSPLHPNFSTSKSGKYDTSLYRLTATNRNGLYNNLADHLEVHGVQVEITASNGGSYVGIKTTNQNQTATDIACVIAHCIVKAVISSGSVICFNTRFPDAAANGTSRVWNCIAFGPNGSTGFNNDFGQDTDVGEYYNCTAACEFGFIEDATMKVVNCLSTGATIGFVGTFATGSNFNSEDDGNGAPGANSRTLQTFSFVNAGADDYHLQAGDGGAKDFGTSSVGGLFTDDIDGGTRTGSWDIGADEQGSPGAGGYNAVPLLQNYYRMIRG